jgi:hypothetical protein
MTTREWHELLKPVLPHASSDANLPELGVIRIESTPDALYAVATDRYTLAAERHPLAGTGEVTQPVHVDSKEAAATLRFFTHSKDYDPPLHVTIDTVPVPVQIVGERRSVNAMGITLHRDDGAKLAMHDHRDPSLDPMAGWRKILAGVMLRAPGGTVDGLDMFGWQLARWAHAARKGERLTVYAGPKPGDPLLVTVERHFAGIIALQQYLDAPAKVLNELPWLAEIAVNPETGEVLGD